MVETKASHYRLEHLPKARRQAAKLGAELGIWVTPVICLHKRKGRWAPFEASGVWIVPHESLCDWILARRTARAA
jgi:hypothetical protein